MNGSLFYFMESLDPLLEGLVVVDVMRLDQNHVFWLILLVRFMLVPYQIWSAVLENLVELFFLITVLANVFTKQME